MGDFKVKYDVNQYNYAGWDIIPDVDKYLAHDEIINADEFTKGNIDLCVWKRQPIPAKAENEKEFIEREVSRCMRTGVFIAVKDTVFWIPPNYYQFLQYGVAGGGPPQFRLKALKKRYFKIHVRNSEYDIGTYIIKNRQDGETTEGMSDALWESASYNMDIGTIAMQSKTQQTVIMSCWRTLLMQWNVYPMWFKNAVYSDYSSGNNNAEKMKFMQAAMEGVAPRDVLLLHAPSVYNALDSLNNVRRCILDEVNKWKEASFFSTFQNYSKFIAPGNTRKGIFDIFSSPADEEGKWNEEAYEFWKGSDPNELTKFGTTKTRVKRYYSDPLEGVEGFYDKWGDADPQIIKDWIDETRANTPKDKLMGEVRAYPLNEEEMFGSTDVVSQWSNTEGIRQRKIYLLKRKYKDEITKEPTVLYGNLDWIGGAVDLSDVEFRAADVEDFDVDIARWCLSEVEQPRPPLQNAKEPPRIICDCLGVDPIGRRHVKINSRKSSAGMVNWRFLNLLEPNKVNYPNLIYLNRPDNEHIFYEDVIKTMIYKRARVQYENITHGMGEYIEDRGYHAWLLPSRGEGEGSKLTGDAPEGRGGFLDEGITLLNAALNRPIREGEPYPLQLHWFYRLLEDYTKFNRKNTKDFDLSMATFQALIGVIKMTYMRPQEKSELNDAVFDFLFT